jgi:hypothetical protein
VTDPAKRFAKTRRTSRVPSLLPSSTNWTPSQGRSNSAASNARGSRRRLAVGSPSLVVLADGVGVFGPPDGTAFGLDLSPEATPPGGLLTVPGLALPVPPLGASASVQAAYLDATSPVGFRLSWARTFSDL